MFFYKEFRIRRIGRQNRFLCLLCIQFKTYSYFFVYLFACIFVESLKANAPIDRIRSCTDCVFCCCCCFVSLFNCVHRVCCWLWVQLKIDLITWNVLLGRSFVSTRMFFTLLIALEHQCQCFLFEFETNPNSKGAMWFAGDSNPHQITEIWVNSMKVTRKKCPWTLEPLQSSRAEVERKIIIAIKSEKGKCVYTIWMEIRTRTHTHSVQPKTHSCVSMSSSSLAKECVTGNSGGSTTNQKASKTLNIK